MNPRRSDRAAFLRRRLARFGLWGFVVLAVGLAVRVALGALFTDLPSPLDFGGQAAATLALLGVWLFVRGERPISARALSVVDAVAMNAVALGYCVMTVALPLIAHPVLILLLAMTFTFTLRATYVPSSVRQTVLVHASAAVWILTAAALTAVRFAEVDAQSPEGSIRGKLITATVWWTFNSGAAVAATSVIYGLRREVREAMQLGQYTLEDRIGAGGMGTIYRARHALLRRPTAIKLLPPEKNREETIARFEREVQRTAELSHPNVVTVFDYGRTHDGIFYYAMELLDGLDLQALIDAHGPMDPARAVHVLSQMCEGLAAAHEVGLVHRDVKPANVLLMRGGRSADHAKLLDFGLLKEVGGATDSALTAENTLLGTPACMAPEQIRDPEVVDARSDIYAVGAVGYFLLAGHHVFEATSVVEVAGKHLHEQPAPLDLDDLPEGLEEIILRCLEKDPSDRPSSAAELGALLTSLETVRAWPIAEAQKWWANEPAAELRDASRRPGTMVPVDLVSRRR